MGLPDNHNTNGNSLLKKNVLLIGAGGIGCEVLKNLVLCGVQSITVVDLDTIEVSNLNRQFLFRREHVGMPKSTVAAEAMRKIRPNVDIRSIHGNVLDSNVLSINFIRQFACVINALDNVQARSHVNRLCIACNVPLIETGSAGYLGQTSFIAKGLTECYDCTPRKDERNRTYPACTIRNTPSEPAHCVIWAKYLFGQLFGEADPDAEVSPDPDDPELSAGKATSNDNSRVPKVTTRQWAEQISYDPNALLNKLFREDIIYLLRLDSLWKKRIPPVPLDYTPLEVNGDSNADLNETNVEQRDHEVWSQAKCILTFCKSVMRLREKFQNEGPVTFDKDDDLAIDFVTSAANLRSTVFHIANLKRFTVKSVAGNIIAAVATTNSVIAGSAVIMVVLNVLSKSNSLENGLVNNLQEINLRRVPVLTGRARNRTQSVFVTSYVRPPNPSCYVCSPSSKGATLFELGFDFADKGATAKAIRERLLQGKLHFATPELVTNSGRMLISADDEENDEKSMNRTMSDAGIASGTIFLAEDMSQSISVSFSFTHIPGVSFEDAVLNFQYTCPDLSAPPVQPIKSVARKRHVSGNVSPTSAPAAKKMANGGDTNGHAANGDVCTIEDDRKAAAAVDVDDEDCIFVA